MKTARLEIRISEEDKQFLQKMCKKESCTMTALLQEHIDTIIKQLKYAEKKDELNEA